MRYQFSSPECQFASKWHRWHLSKPYTCENFKLCQQCLLPIDWQLPLWCTSAWTVWHLPTWRLTVLQSRRCPAEDSCDLPHQDSYTFQEPRQWHLGQGCSRSLVPLSGMTCLPDWRILPWAKTHSGNCSKQFLFDRWLLLFAHLWSLLTCARNVRNNNNNNNNSDTISDVLFFETNVDNNIYLVKALGPTLWYIARSTHIHFSWFGFWKKIPKTKYILKAVCQHWLLFWNQWWR